MKKNIVKTMLKAAATTAMVAAMFVGGNKMEAKAELLDDMHKFMALTGVTEEELMYDIDVQDAYFTWVFAQQGEDINKVADEVMAELNATGDFNSLVESLKAVTVSKNDMLELVNADRAANGAGNLAWNADLETVARQRAIEVMSNVQTAEFAEADAKGDVVKRNEIIHKGYTLQENAIVSWSSNVATMTANDNWIASAGHHAQRIKAEWTQYACASYTDPVTGMETWVEVFQ